MNSNMEINVPVVKSRTKYLLFIPHHKPLTARYMAMIQNYLNLDQFDVVIDDSPSFKQMYDNFKVNAMNYEIAVMHHSDWYLDPSGLMLLLNEFEDNVAAVGCHPYVVNDAGSIVPMEALENKPIYGFIQLYAINPKLYFKDIPATYMADTSDANTVWREMRWAIEQKHEFRYVPIRSFPYQEANY